MNKCNSCGLGRFMGVILFQFNSDIKADNPTVPSTEGTICITLLLRAHSGIEPLVLIDKRIRVCCKLGFMVKWGFVAAQNNMRAPAHAGNIRAA